MTSFWGLNLLNNAEPTEEQLRRWKPSILVSFNPAQAQRLARWAKDWGGMVAYRRFPDNALNLSPDEARARARSMVAEVGTDVLIVSQNESPVSASMVAYEIAFAEQALALGSTPVIGAVATGHPTETNKMPDGSDYVDWMDGAAKDLAVYMNTHPVYYGGHEYADRFSFTYNWPWLVNRSGFLFHFYPGVRHLGLEFGWDSTDTDQKGYRKVTQDHTLELAQQAYAAYRHFPSNSLGMAWFAWGWWNINGDFQIDKYLSEDTLDKIFAMETDMTPGITTYQGPWVAKARTSLWENPGSSRIRLMEPGSTWTFTWDTQVKHTNGWWQYVFDPVSNRWGWVHRSAFKWPFLPTQFSAHEPDPRDDEIERLKRDIAILTKENTSYEVALRYIRDAAINEVGEYDD